MLTIKHVVGGKEHLSQAVSVSYDPKKAELTGHGCPDSVSEDKTTLYKLGYAYVMGDGGKPASGEPLLVPVTTALLHRACILTVS